jgi:hypothetical protein
MDHMDLPPGSGKAEPSAIASIDPATSTHAIAAATPLTVAEYTGLQAAYAHFNAELFDDELLDVLIVLVRRPHSLGYFSADRFAVRDGAEAKHHELSLNPDGFFGRSDAEILSTLVHEQCHVLQAARGTAPKRAYHNRDFADQMERRGLCTSNTGMPGGKRTGAKMSHFIIPGAAFERSYDRLRATGWRLNIQSAPYAGPLGGKKNKVKFSCPRCRNQSVWGRPGSAILCKPCSFEAGQAIDMVAEGAASDLSQATE